MSTLTGDILPQITQSYAEKDSCLEMNLTLADSADICQREMSALISEISGRIKIEGTTWGNVNNKIFTAI